MTQKLKTLTKIFLSCLVFILCSCEKENIDVNNQDASVTNAKNWFEKSNPELSILKYTKQINWNHAIVTDGVNGKVVEVPIVLNDNIALKSDNKSLITYNRLMFIADEKGTYKLSHVLITTKEKTFTTSDKAFNFYKIKDGFEGYITVLNTKNKVDSFNSIKKKSASSVSGKIKNEEMICIGLFEIFSDGSSRFVGNLFCDGQGGGGDGSGGSGGYGGDGTAPTETTTQIIEKNIDDSQLTPCLKGILEQLKNASNSDIAKVLEKLGTNFGYDVTMQMGAMKYVEDYAETTKISKDNYLITVSPDYSGATKLFRAQSLLHELTHAYFISLADDYSTYPTNAPFADYPSLYQKYLEKNFPGTIAVAEHEAMTKKYIDAFASALQEYDANYTVPYQVYTDLAWYGLRDTPTFNKNFPEGSTDRIRMQNRYGCEQGGRTWGAGTPNEQSPVGKNCN